MRELNVVISGFDHYDGVEVNPAVEVPKAIAEQGLGVSSAPDDPLEQVAVTVHAVSIPVSFAKAWPTLKETIEATKPNIVIATGLKHAARGVMLERCATNLMDAIKPDADNVLKAIADACNEIVWKDDEQMTDVLIRKRYSVQPSANVVVTVAGVAA